MRSDRGWCVEDARAGGLIVHPGARTLMGDEHPRLAWLTENASPVHGNAHRMADSPFGEPLVLGALSVAVVIGLSSAATCTPDLAGRASAAWSRIALLAPVLAGDTLRAVSLIRHVDLGDDGLGGLVERTIEGHNQRGEIVVRVDEIGWAPTRAAGAQYDRRA